MGADDYQSYNPEVDQPALIRKTRSGNCDSECSLSCECSSDEDCSGSNTCSKCCFLIGFGNICRFLWYFLSVEYTDVCLCTKFNNKQWLFLHVFICSWPKSFLCCFYTALKAKSTGK